MLTFRQYLDNLSDEAKTWLQNHCCFVDLESEDGYKHRDYSKFDQKGYLEMYNSIAGDQLAEIITGVLLAKDDNGKYVNRKDLSEKERFDYLYNILEKYHAGRSLKSAKQLYALPLEYVRRAFEHQGKYYHGYNEDRPDALDFETLMLFTDDFSRIDWNALSIHSMDYVENATIEVLPKEKVKEILKAHPTRLWRNKLPIDCEVFDELFFGENGWDDSQKLDIIDNIYHKNAEDFEDFMKRIVAVDKHYLRYVKIFFKGNKKLASELYRLKMPEDERATYRHPGKHKYRYSDEYRKLFWVARCCAKGEMTGACVDKIGNVATIMKYYGTDFDKIFDMMYPELSEQQTEVTAE